MFSMKVIQSKVERSERSSKRSASHKSKPPAKKKRKRIATTAEVQESMDTADSLNSKGRNSSKKSKMQKLATDIKTLDIDGTKSSNSSLPVIPKVSPPILKKTKKGKNNGVKKITKKDQTKRVAKSFVSHLKRNSVLEKRNNLGRSCEADTSYNTQDSGKKAQFYKVRESDEKQNLWHDSDTDDSYPALSDWWEISEEEKLKDNTVLELKRLKKKQKASQKTPVEACDERNRYGKRKQEHLEDKQKLVGEAVDVIATRRNTLVMALTPGSTIYIQGVVFVCSLVGTVKVLGYTLQEGETQTVYSLASGALFGICSMDACNIDLSDSRLKDKGIPSKWLKDVLIKQAGPLGILEMQRYSPPVLRLLSQAGWGQLFRSKENQEQWCDVGATPITKSNCKDYYLIKEVPEWHDIIDTIKSCWTCGSVPRVVVCGGKGTGKSTFFKYISNNLLCETSESGIMCLDLDPGQSEFSLPTCVSLIRLVKPLLGPVYVRKISEVASYAKQVLVSETSPQFMLQKYMAAVQYLHQLNLEQPSIPLLVNTMGWTRGTGLGIMLDILRIIKPTHVIQIQSSYHKINFPMELHCETVKSAKGGIITKANETELYYRLLVLTSSVRGYGAPNSFKPKVLRELAVLTHVGQFIDQGQQQEVKETEDKTSNLMKLSWSNVVLHVCDEQIPKKRILQVMNGQLVALCQVSVDNIENVGPDLPKQLTEDSGFGELIGWGVISGIDPVTRELYILTSILPQELTTQVNAVVMPKLYLPESVYQLFSSGEAPYLQHQRREGAGRLRVERQIKPRIHSVLHV